MKQSQNEAAEAKWYEKASGKKQHSKKNIEKHAAIQEKRLLKKQNEDKKEGKEGPDSKKVISAGGKVVPAGGKADSRKAFTPKTFTAASKNASAGGKRSAGAADSAKKTSFTIPRKPLFSKDIPAESRAVLEHFADIISSVRSLSGKQKVQLASDIRTLSHKLTDERSDRRLGYMNDSTFISAYLSYFLWWNLVRLVPLFAALDDSAFSLEDGSVALDIGSGPLTVPMALWLAKPSLRSKKITWYALDISQNALAAGEELFLTVAARTVKEGEEPWNIIRVRGELGDTIRQKAQLITCANVFNEVVQNQTMPPDYLAKKYTNELLAYAQQNKGTPQTNPDVKGETSGDAAPKASNTAAHTSSSQTILLVEPGDPKSARFISLMRDALMRRDFMPLAPCPHALSCPMEGKKGGKWCNFAFSTEDAPSSLLKLSEKAGLPKERAVLSFILSKRDGTSAQKDSGKENAGEADKATPAHDSPAPKHLDLRITSDFIKLPELHKSGYYACSQLGLLLAVDEHRLQPENGELLTVRCPSHVENLERDKKSGALMLRL